MDKVLVLGKGFLGKQFQRNGFTVWGRDKFEVDVSDVEECVKQLFTQEGFVDKYDVIVNCIGNANTRRCEDPDFWQETYAINADLPKHLSIMCNEHNIKFVQISSGCVYDSNNEPQTEESFLSSHCRYVVSKLAGEFNCHRGDIILRPRLYFGESKDKNNLLCKIQNFDKFLTEMNSYTSVQTIVESTKALIENDCSGVFNVAQSGFSNLVDIAKLIGLEPEEFVTDAELRQNEGLYLVNNIMDISKLERFYKPRSIEDEITICWGALKSKL